MARYRWYDEECSIDATITIPNDGECRVVTRRKGHVVCDMPIPLAAAERAVEEYGYVEITDGRPLEDVQRAFKLVDLSSRGSDEEYAKVTELER